MHNNKRYPFMRRLEKACVLLLLPVALVPATGDARAQDQNQTPGIEFELGAGGVVAPGFEGSSRYVVSPYPIFGFEYLQLPNGFTLGGGDGQGFSIVPSFRMRGERTAADNPALAGLNDVDTALELGAGVRYTAGNIRVLGDLRHGVTGHQGVTGELGADMIIKPSEQITASFGPRVSFASSDYMKTYFGVSASEAASSSLPAFNAGGGIKSAGLEANLRYRFSENWALDSGASWSRLVGDAGKSPVVSLSGSEDQFTFKLGLVRKFRIDF